MSISPVPPYPQVTIGDSVDYDSYADLATADAYMAATPNAAAWAALDSDTRGQLLVTATRTFDRQVWQGTATDDAVAEGHQWPRTGLSGVEDDELPTDLVYGTIELAWYIQTTPAVQTSINTENLKKRQKAGSVEIEYFRSFANALTRFPLPVQELIGKWLGGAGFAGASASGLCGESVAARRYNLNRGF